MSSSKDRYDYQGEKLSQARSALMLPHTQGEENSLASAFELCDRAFFNFDMKRLKDDDALRHAQTIQRLMTTEDLVADSPGEGLWIKRGRLMSDDERSQFSHAVDELADFFNREFWSD